MSDCRFGVSPVNYPDPDPVAQTNVWSHLATMRPAVSSTDLNKALITYPYVNNPCQCKYIQDL